MIFSRPWECRFRFCSSVLDIANSTVKFDSKGDGLARYTIYNYQRDTRTGKTDYTIVGKWHNELNMNADDVVWPAEHQAKSTSTPSPSPQSNASLLISDLHPTAFPSKEGKSPIPTSVCSEPCKAGEIMISQAVSETPARSKVLL